MEIRIDVPAGKKAEWVNGVLTLVDETPKDNRPVTERVKTFEDAVRELGDEHPFVKEWHLGDGLSADLEAYLKLRIIAAALNEGWEPKFTTDEYRYFPWFVLYTEEEYNELSDEDKTLVVQRSYFYSYSYGGVAFVYADYDSSYTFSAGGSRLAFKNSDLAKYAGKQFIEIYADFVFKPKCESDNK
ncbi:MAG: hypothetical protein IKU35_06770 [Bacteroidaceae bacterium]|nr:hypothetical protein [Bacteroidaceae bacterium]